jgi:AcrR family transcriptional regulator
MFKTNSRARASEPAGQERARSEILKAAREIFAELGYQGTTIRGICARARKNIALVKYYFGDKEGLYAEVLKACAGASRVGNVRAALNQDAPPEEALRAAIRARLRITIHRDIESQTLRILSREFANPTPVMRRLVGEITQPMYKRLLEVVAKIVGLPAEHKKTRLCANSIVGQITLYVSKPGYMAQLCPDFKMTEGEADEIADHIADFSLAYLRSLHPLARGAGARRR